MAKYLTVCEEDSKTVMDRINIDVKVIPEIVAVACLTGFRIFEEGRNKGALKIGAC